MIEPLELKKRIFDSVYGVLRDAILSHVLKAGDRLSVPELARKLGVSRSPVREAVLQLVADGLGTSEPRKGAVVAGPNPNTILALHDIRELLEGLSARRAAHSMNASDVTALKHVLREQRQAVRSGDVRLYVSTDQMFHARIAEIDPDPQLLNFLRVLRDQMRLAVSVAITNPEHLRSGHEEHTAVLEALAAGNAEMAEQAMRTHIVRSRERVAERLRTRSVASDVSRLATEKRVRAHTDPHAKMRPRLN